MVLMILITTWTPFEVHAQETPEVIFEDLAENDPNKEAIEYLKENNVVQGYEDGTFRSLNKINRAEFMKIMVESITEEAQGSFCFPDVNEEWFARYVCYAKSIGLTEGYADGTFKPGEEINFAEASKMISKAFDLEIEDSDEEGPWYETFVKALEGEEAIPTSISDFDKEIARGEMAEIIWRIEEEKKELEHLKYEELRGEPVAIESCDELKELFLSRHADDKVYIMTETMGIEEDANGDEPESSTEVKSETDDYSTTNIQVEGVDEADTVKNDGQYIYMIRDQIVDIVEAYPAENLASVGQIEFEDETLWPSQLYLDGDALVVIGSKYNYEPYDYGFTDIWFPYYHQGRTFVYTYDVSDPTSPILKRSLEFDGDYNSSRKVDDTVYLILNKFDFNYYGTYEAEDINTDEVLPRYYDSERGEDRPIADCTDIRYFPRERSLNYLITAAIPLEGDEEIKSEVMIGNSENIYASKENLYVAATNYETEDYYLDWSNAKTLVYRFGLTPDAITFEDRAKVPGTILNQFSMDEHEDHLRIATTQQQIWGEESRPSKNNLYILNNEMEIVGKLEGIAPGESIHSTRFLGDRGYMVTFESIDPFFVFDLSDPTQPHILGELKIPGYSDYLHPYDENHILGFGKNTTESGDFVLTEGIKVALFDVTDVTQPKELFKIDIGDRGTESEVLYNHKALLFSRSKNLLAFPVLLAEAENEGAYAEYTFQGAYVYNLDLENGFSERGRITHYDEMSGDYWDWYDYSKDISRILYMDENLYTISQGMVKASDINTTEEKNRLEFANEIEDGIIEDEDTYEEKIE